MSFIPRSTIFCSINHSLSIDNSSNVWSFGSGALTGQSETDDILPKIIPNLVNIKSIDCGYHHSICCDYDGFVYSFGYNEEHQLGFSTNSKSISTPTKIDTLPLITQISCGLYYTFCLTDNNTLYTFGTGKFGELGLGKSKKVCETPTEIPNLHNIEFIECGGHFVICKSFSNSIYSWGGGILGQLGTGNKENIYIPTICENWPNDIISIKCGIGHSLTLTREGFVYACGSNTSGKGGLSNEQGTYIVVPTNITSLPLIKKIECGYQFSMCIDIKDNLWVFGENNGRQLGLGDNQPYNQPVKHQIQDVIDLSHGGNHAFIKTANGDIYGFGDNTSGQLGIKPKQRAITTRKIFDNYDDIWASKLYKSRAKSARK